MFDTCVACGQSAEDEYGFYEYVPALGHEFLVMWKLCPEHLQFAEEVVECVSNLDDVEERERWTI